MKFFFILSLVSFFLIFSMKSYAFPENIRHSYTNCITCHISPAGGGMLTEYGRELSRDLISMWGKEGNEVKSLYGALKTPTWLDIGGDLRTAQIYRDNPDFTEAKFIPMQIDSEVAVKSEKLAAVATLGLLRKVKRGEVQYEWGSRRHYALYKINPVFNVRAGRFLTSFGINVPDHIISTKRGLNFDQGSETYNLELSYISKNVNYFVTGIIGRPDDSELNRERGGALTISFSFLNKYKIGNSYYYGSNSFLSRHLLGVFGLLGINERIYFLTEIDFQRQQDKRISRNTENHRWGIFSYHRAGYEMKKGLHFIFTYDQAKNNLKDPLTLSYSFGPGLLWYPRPHFETSITWLKQKNPSYPDQLTDLVFWMFHFYL